MKDEQLKALHVALLEIMDEIDRLCRANDIDYFLDSGSALGAIRHKGFIPWDDDIDVGMTRENYVRFIEVAGNQLGKKFFLQMIDTDPHYNKLHAKIRKNNTVFLEHANENINMHQGVFIDIFPFDRIPVSFSKCIIGINESFQRMFCRKVDEGYSNSFLKETLTKICVGNNAQKRFDKICKMFAYRNAKGMISYSYFFEEHYVFPSDIFDEVMDVEFEGRKYMIMKGYETYLHIMYGDYMQLPPAEKRITHDIAKLQL